MTRLDLLNIFFRLDSQNGADGMIQESVHRFVTNDLTIRAAAVNATEVVKEMQKLHGAKPLSTVAVGRAMVGAILMAANLKEDQEVGVLIRGNGALNYVYAQSNYNGKVRGYSSNPQYDPGHLDVNISLKKAIGNGTLTVVRHLPFQRQPYEGTIELVSSEIGDDLAYYLHQSQQIRSIVSLGVFLNSNGLVESAGGVLVEVMPGVENSAVDLLEKNFEANKSTVSKSILQGLKPRELIAPFLNGYEYTELPHNHPLNYSCPCTKERVMDAIQLLGLDELQDIITKGESVSVTCQMCGRPYELMSKDVEVVRAQLHKNSLH